MSRWDWLEGAKARALPEVIAEELGKVIAAELARWPPDVEWIDENARARLAHLADRPAADTWRAGFQLARWELTRESAAAEAWRRGAGGDERRAAELIALVVTEAMFDVIERTAGRVKRRHLGHTIDVAERIVLAALTRRDD